MLGQKNAFFFQVGKVQFRVNSSCGTERDFYKWVFD